MTTMPMDTLRVIPGFSKYKITNNGQVYSEFANRFLLLRNDKDGYRISYIKSDNKGLVNVKIHRLVLQTWSTNPKNKPHVNHINGKKDDNRLENLEWATPEENEQHAHKNNIKDHKKDNNPHAILTEAKAKEIREKLKSKLSCAKIGKQYGVSRHTIFNIKANKSWKT